MKARIFTILGMAIALALLLLPGAATARVRPASRRTPAEISEQLTLPGTNGFHVGVSLENRRRLTFSALRFDNLIESASYKLRVQPRRGSGDIVARLGKLGRVDVRFVPDKVRRVKPPRGCRGGDTLAEEGHFVGLIAFRGEHDFTRVHARRAAGTITRVPALECKPTGPAPNEKQLERELEAVEREDQEEQESKEEAAPLAVGLTAIARRQRVAFKASKLIVKDKHGKGLSLTSFTVIGSRHRGRIEESSVALDLFDKGSNFLIPDRGEPTSEATLKPPAPFTGSATFRNDSAKTPSWTGDLKIELPGFGLVRLAGRGTRATMCEGLACQTDRASARTLARLQRLAR